MKLYPLPQTVLLLYWKFHCKLCNADRQLLSEFQFLKCFRFSLSQEKHTCMMKIDMQYYCCLLLEVKDDLISVGSRFYVWLCVQQSWIFSFQTS